MPISSFGSGLQKAVLFLPGTYGTSLVRNHTMRGVFAEMQRRGVPEEAIAPMKDALDCNLYFFGSHVGIPVMYLILGGTVAALIAAYILLNVLKTRK